MAVIYYFYICHISILKYDFFFYFLYYKCITDMKVAKTFYYKHAIFSPVAVVTLCFSSSMKVFRNITAMTPH